MSSVRHSGARILAAALERLGADCVFGVPGSHSIPVYEALRCSATRAVLTTHELAATFMAIGYFRATGRAGVVLAVPGPGFTYTVTALTEAYLDSAAVVCIVPVPDARADRRFQLQVIDQRAIAAPVTKRCIRVDALPDLARALDDAFATATTGEPGPVLVEICASVLVAEGPAPRLAPRTGPPRLDPVDLERLLQLVEASPRIAMLVGGGAIGAPDAVRALAELLRAPVVTTTSGRGILAEDHPLVIGGDLGVAGVARANAVFESSDLVLMLGCKCSHNGTGGFRLRIAPEKLVQIDASAATLGANYPGRLMLQADVPTTMHALVGSAPRLARRTMGWTSAEYERSLVLPQPPVAAIEPIIRADRELTAAEFFAIVRRVMPRDSILVTDSGLHQMLARAHYPVLAPNGLMVPSDFQSMGFGLPAAIGVKLSAPHRTVAVVLGDGGFAMTAMEIMTAVRARLTISILLFSDGNLGLIRLSQLATYGRSAATEFDNPDFSLFAAAVGAQYRTLAGHDPAQVLGESLATPGVTLIEVPVVDSSRMKAMRVRALVRRSLRRAARAAAHVARR